MYLKGVIHICSVVLWGLLEDSSRFEVQLHWSLSRRSWSVSDRQLVHTGVVWSTIWYFGVGLQYEWSSVCVCGCCRYLALESMCLLAASEFSHDAVKKHQDTVIAALKAGSVSLSVCVCVCVCVSLAWHNWGQDAQPLQQDGCPS